MQCGTYLYNKEVCSALISLSLSLGMCVIDGDWKSFPSLLQHSISEVRISSLKLVELFMSRGQFLPDSLLM